MVTRLHCIYKHTCPDGSVYIGQTLSGQAEHRWQGGNSYKGQPFYEAIERFGWSNIKHEIIEDDIPETDVDDRERYYIKLYDSFTNGWNATIGGRHGGWTNKENAIAMYVLTVCGYRHATDWLGFDPTDEFYEDFNSALMVIDDCYKKVCRKSIISRHRAGKRRRFEAEAFLSRSRMLLEVAASDAGDEVKDTDVKAIIDETTGLFALLLNNMYGEMNPAPEDEEYVTSCFERKAEQVNAIMSKIFQGGTR